MTSDASTSPDALVGPVAPPAEIREELEAYLESDQTALGDVWRRTRAGESPEEIQAARGTAYPNFVWSYNRLATALLEGDLPTAPTVALTCARKFRRILATAGLSSAAARVLTANLRELERRSDDPAARDAEERVALQTTEKAEASSHAGIYVYALPHYLRYPYDPDSERTLLKVGHSRRDIMQRFRLQTRTTALPEEPILLRIYGDEQRASAEVERAMHRLLEAADHARSAARTGGTEWFLTTLRFLDVIAETLRLKIQVVNDPDLLD